MFCILLKIARSILERVIQTICHLSNRMQEEIFDEIERMMRELDEFWRAPDADSFREEIARDVLPFVRELIDLNSGMCNCLRDAYDVIQEAEKRSYGLVGDVSDRFGAIY